jgi:hypothetical protein
MCNRCLYKNFPLMDSPQPGDNHALGSPKFWEHYNNRLEEIPVDVLGDLPNSFKYRIVKSFILGSTLFYCSSCFRNVQPVSLSSPPCQLRTAGNKESLRDGEEPLVIATLGKSKAANRSSSSPSRLLGSGRVLMDQNIYKSQMYIRTLIQWLRG